MVRNSSPWLSSVVISSDSAVESHDFSGLPERFLKPSTAMERRRMAVGGADAASFFRCMKRYAALATARRATIRALARYALARFGGAGKTRLEKTGAVPVETGNSRATANSPPV